MKASHALIGLTAAALAGATAYASLHDAPAPQVRLSESRAAVPEVSSDARAVPAKAQGCHAANGLPDPSCTPGATDPAKTAAILCAKGYTTKTVRPPASYTTALKIRQLQQYDYADKGTATYEEDHLISLELGGSPTAPQNLWPEPWNGPEGAHAKDVVENCLHKAVCVGKINLAAAQQAIAMNWEQAASLCK